MAVEVLVPPLGTNVDTLILVQWLVEEGTMVEAGQPLFSVETDKATLEVEAPGSGKLAGVTAKPGDEIGVLSRIAFLLGPGEALASEEVIPDFTGGPDESTPEGLDDFTCVIPLPTPNPKRVFISPRARRVADEERFEWLLAKGTGPEGAIVEKDVRVAIAEWFAENPDGVRTIPFSGTRAAIAERMLASVHSAALVTLTTEVDATELVEARRRVNVLGKRVSYNDFFLWLLGRGLTEHPRLNTWLEDDSIRYGGPVNVAIAVETESGLLAPVVHGVHHKGLLQIAEESAALIARVRAGRAGARDFGGSRFTLTNLGAYGIDAFTPLPNLPGGAILGIGRIRPSPSVVDGALCIRQQVWLSLTFDHRLLDGAPAARFLQRYSEMLQDGDLLASASTS